MATCERRSHRSGRYFLCIHFRLVLGPGPVTERTAPLVDDPIGRAFASRASDVQVQGEGKVIRVLANDLDSSRHQRFIVELASGQTLLISHNVDIAPRIEGLNIGDSVRFNGEYVWNEKGGVIHWTHHERKVVMSQAGSYTMARRISN